MDKARRIAVQALVRQEESGFANLVLNAVLEHQDLNGRDRAFVSALFYGVTERAAHAGLGAGELSEPPAEQAGSPGAGHPAQRPVSGPLHAGAPCGGGERVGEPVPGR